MPKRANLRLIKRIYRDLIAKWHPDTCPEGSEVCKEMSQRINRAYEIVLDYCECYEYSFEKGGLMGSADGKANYEGWWQDQFGNDPLWGGVGKKRDGNSRG